MRLTPIRPPQNRLVQLGLHLLAIVVVLMAIMGQATLAGQLWPLDLQFSALIAAAGLAVQAIVWWPAALGFVAVAVFLPNVALRLAIWPATTAIMIVLHGAHQGMIPLATLGLANTLLLYTLPTVLPILLGSALRVAFHRTGTAPAPNALYQTYRMPI